MNLHILEKKSNYKEILDIFICSSSLYTFISECRADYESGLHSDHIPVKIKMNNLNELEKFDHYI